MTNMRTYAKALLACPSIFRHAQGRHAQDERQHGTFSSFVGYFLPCGQKNNLQRGQIRDFRKFYNMSEKHNLRLPNI